MTKSSMFITEIWKRPRKKERKQVLSPLYVLRCSYKRAQQGLCWGTSDYTILVVLINKNVVRDAAYFWVPLYLLCQVRVPSEVGRRTSQYNTWVL